MRDNRHHRRTDSSRLCSVASVSASAGRLSRRQRAMRGKCSAMPDSLAARRLNALEGQLKDEFRLDGAHRAEALSRVAADKSVDLPISSCRSARNRLWRLASVRRHPTPRKGVVRIERGAATVAALRGTFITASTAIRN